MSLPLEGYADSHAPMAEQRSAAWLAERVGHVTASRFGDVLDFTKAGKEGADRAKYRLKLVIERLTGEAAENFVSTAMQWGTDTEAQARMAYEAHSGAMVHETGFIHHKSLRMVGGSPDGLINDDGGIEIKCPFDSGVHVTTILNGMPEKHIAQIQGLMWITGRQWWDFVSYDPRLPDGLSIYVQHVPRDNEYIEKLQNSVIAFLLEVDEQEKKLRAIMAPKSAPPPPSPPSPSLHGEDSAVGADHSTAAPDAFATLDAAASPDAQESATTRDYRAEIKDALGFASKSLTARFELKLKGRKIDDLSDSAAKTALEFLTQEMDKESA